MKKLLLTAAAMMVAVGVYAQGSVNFANFASGVDAPVFDVDNTTALDGNTYMAQLYAGADEASLAPVGAAVPFLSGAGAGYWAPTARQIASVAPGSPAAVQVRAWNTTTGADWDSALIRGESAVLTVTTGGAGAPPSLPAVMTGLESFSLVVIPEPSTIALGVLGAAALLFARRRK